MDGKYDKEKDMISLKWHHPTLDTTENDADEVIYDLHVSIDEGPYQMVLENTSELTYELTEPIDGAIYRYRLIAKDKAYPTNESIPFIIEIEIEKPLFQLPDPFDNTDDDSNNDEGTREDDDESEEEEDSDSGTSLLNLNL
jgi:hypothetical protein